MCLFCAAYRERIVRGENKHPSPESQLAYYPDSSSVLLVSVNKNIYCDKNIIITVHGCVGLEMYKFKLLMKKLNGIIKL